MGASPTARRSTITRCTVPYTPTACCDHLEMCWETPLGDQPSRDAPYHITPTACCDHLEMCWETPHYRAFQRTPITLATPVHSRHMLALIWEAMHLNLAFARSSNHFELLFLYLSSFRLSSAKVSREKSSWRKNSFSREQPRNRRMSCTVLSTAAPTKRDQEMMPEVLKAMHDLEYRCCFCITRKAPSNDSMPFPCAEQGPVPIEGDKREDPDAKGAKGHKHGARGNDSMPFPRVGQRPVPIEGGKRKDPDAKGTKGDKRMVSDRTTFTLTMEFCHLQHCNDPDTKGAKGDKRMVSDTTTFALTTALMLPTNGALHARLNTGDIPAFQSNHKTERCWFAGLNREIQLLIMSHSFPRGGQGMILPKFLRQGIEICGSVCLAFFKLVMHTIADDMGLFIKLPIADILRFFGICPTGLSCIPKCRTDYPPARFCKALTICYLKNFVARDFAELLPFYMLADLRCSEYATPFKAFVETVYTAMLSTSILHELSRTNASRELPPPRAAAAADPIAPVNDDSKTKHDLIPSCNIIGWDMSSPQTLYELAKIHLGGRPDGSFIWRELIRGSLHFLHHHTVTRVEFSDDRRHAASNEDHKENVRYIVFNINDQTNYHTTAAHRRRMMTEKDGHCVVVFEYSSGTCMYILYEPIIRTRSVLASAQKRPLRGPNIPPGMSGCPEDDPQGFIYKSCWKYYPMDCNLLVCHCNVS